MSKVSGLFVVARNSTFTYKGKAVKVRQVAEELGVRYVLEGSVRRSGEYVRVNAQLIDAVAGNHLWAESYDRELTDIFALQSEIALKIVTELEVKLASGEMARLQRRTTSSPEAYELFLRSREAWFLSGHEKEDLLAALQLTERAIELDPNFTAAWAELSRQYAVLGRNEILERDQAFEEAEKLARKAIALDDTFAGGYSSLSFTFLVQGEIEQAITFNEKALALAPNDAEAARSLGRLLNWTGRSEEAISVLKRAMRLHPYYTPNYPLQLGWAFLAAGHYEEAHEAFLEYAARQPNSFNPHLKLAMTYSLLGQPEKARAEAAESLRIHPRTIAQHIKLAPYRDSNPALMKVEVDAMRAAGFPE